MIFIRLVLWPLFYFLETVDVRVAMSYFDGGNRIVVINL